MSAMQRTKGRSGEQEVARLLRDHLGLGITRNWQQQAAQKGKSDINGVPGWSLEVKRAREKKADWWRQACDQADEEGCTPALIYRLDGQGRGLQEIEKWRVVVPLAAICNEDVDLEHTAEMTMAAWIQIVRERIDEIDCKLEEIERKAKPVQKPRPPAPVAEIKAIKRIRRVPRTTQQPKGAA